jgi:archaellum biogenesis ATPase FlaH
MQLQQQQVIQTSLFEVAGELKTAIEALKFECAKEVAQRNASCQLHPKFPNLDTINWHN